MTPKEKAIELMGRFYHTSFGESWKPFVKRCASNCVDEIINAEPTMPSELKDSYWLATEEAFKYWKKVKEEIELI